MKGNKKKVLNIITGLVIAGLSLIPLKSNAQDNTVKIRGGPAATCVDTRDNFKGDYLGLGLRLERNLTKRLSLEGGGDFYAAFIKNNYSKIQINYGIKYKPLIRNGWNLGIKAALGASSEYYKPQDEISRQIIESRQVKSLNKIIEIQVEKEFRLFGKDRHVNLGISEEFGKNNSLAFKLFFGDILYQN